MARQTQTRVMERALVELATRQRGVVGRDQLLALGFGVEAIERRIASHRLLPIHRTAYAVGHSVLTQHGRWLGAVLACGDDSLLSHRSAAALWGITRARPGEIDVTAPRGRQGRPRRPGIRLHRGKIVAVDRAEESLIPVTSVARTLFDLAEVVDRGRLERTFEEADRLGVLEMRALLEVCERGYGRRALRPIRRIISEARATTRTRSPLEDRFQAFCRTHRLPPPVTNVDVLGHEVDAFWPAARLVVEMDSFEFHGHRAAFERDRARDAAFQANGYRVLRLTDRRLRHEADEIAAQIRLLLRNQGGV